MSAAERVHELRQAARDSGGSSTPLRAGGPAHPPSATAPARATNPLAGEGRTALRAGSLDVSSLETGSAGSNAGRAAFSDDAFRAVAERVFAAGGTWRDVGLQAGIREDSARRRGAMLDIESPRRKGKVRRWTRATLTEAATLANEIGTAKAAQRLGLHTATLTHALSSSGWRRAWVRQ